MKQQQQRKNNNKTIEEINKQQLCVQVFVCACKNYTELELTESDQNLTRV